MRTLFAATGEGVVRIDAGPDGSRATALLVGKRAQCLALDPDRPETIYAGCHGEGVWKSEDGGASWRDLELPAADVFSVAVGPDGAVYAGCEPSALFRSADGGESWEELAALRELPSAPTWSFPPRPWTSHVRWIAPSPHDAELLLVGIELGGLMRSEDGGRTWDHRPGAQPDVHSIAWHPRAADRAYEAGGGGSALSVDSGRTWQPADDGRDRHYTWAVAADEEDPDRWYVSASPGPFHAHRPGRAEAYLYRREGSEPWQALDGGLPQPLYAMPYALLVRGDELYAGLSDGRLYRSSDRGETWQELELAGEPPTRIVALASPA